MNNPPNSLVPRTSLQEQALSRQEQGTSRTPVRKILFTRRIAFGKENLLSFHQDSNMVFRPKDKY